MMKWTGPVKPKTYNLYKPDKQPFWLMPTFPLILGCAVVLIIYAFLR